MTLHKNAIKNFKNLDKSRKTGNRNKTIDLKFNGFSSEKKSRKKKNSPLNSNLITYSSSILTFAGCLCPKKEKNEALS